MHAGNEQMTEDQKEAFIQDLQREVKARGERIAELEAADLTFRPVLTNKDFKIKELKDIAEYANQQGLEFYPSVVGELIEKVKADRFSKIVNRVIENTPAKVLLQMLVELEVVDHQKQIENRQQKITALTIDPEVPSAADSEEEEMLQKENADSQDSKESDDDSSEKESEEEGKTEEGEQGSDSDEKREDASSTPW